MNKKLFALALSLGFAAGSGAVVSDVWSGGVALAEENTGTTYTYQLEEVCVTEDAAWGAGRLTPWQTTSFANGPVTIEFDVLYLKGCNMAPFITTGVDSPMNVHWVGGPDNGMFNPTADSDYADIEYFADEAMTTKHGGTNGSTCWFYPFGTVVGEVSYHVQYIFKAEGTLGIRSYALKEDGTYGTTPYAELWCKNAFDGRVDTTTQYRFGIWYFGSLTIDNYKLSTSSATVYSTDFSGTDWIENQGIPNVNKMYTSVGTNKVLTETITLPEFTGETTETFVGWKAGDKLYQEGEALELSATTTFTAQTIDFSMVNGASIRIADTADESGLRFCSKYNTADYAEIAAFVTESGTMILPTESLAEKTFLMENFDPDPAKKEILIIKAAKTFVDGDNTCFTGVILTIDTSNYARAFSARGYMKITYTSGATAYIYTAYSTENNSRSVQSVAKAVKADTTYYETLSTGAQGVLLAYIGE